MNDIRPKPALYLAVPQIECLRTYIDAWCDGVIAAGGKIDDVQLFNEFFDWIPARFRVTGTQGWDRILLFYSSDSNHAVDLFFELLDEFVARRAEKNS